MVERVTVRRGAFHDPVTLMAAAAEARAVQGVTHVAVGMGEPLNLTIIGLRHGYDLAGEDALGPDDLVVGLRADSDAAAEDALRVVERALAERRGVYEVMDVGPYVFAGDLRGTPVQRIDWRAARPAAA
ncbi:MAG: sucD3, partial [Conexibacter sp.]|nr:sucD3 [Conexibacter sp.]